MENKRWNENYRIRISVHCCFKNGQMREPDIPRVLFENIKSPFDAMKQIRNWFGSKGCLDSAQSILDSMPERVGEMKFIMLRGDRCACKLYIEIYEKG